MLEEGEDVKAHRVNVLETWDSSGRKNQIEARELKKVYETSKGGFWECWKRPYETTGV
jgi:hypothetical protein